MIDNSKTCDRIAEENGVSKDTVIRASKYMKGVEIAEELIPGLKQSILSGQTKVSKADMHRLAGWPTDEPGHKLCRIFCTRS